MNIRTTKLYNFNELSETAKDKAIEKLYDINVNTGFEWWDSTYEDAKTIGIKITEFDIDRASFCRGNFINSHITIAKLICENHGKDCETYKTAKSFLGDLKPLLKDEYNNGDKIEDLEKEFERSILEDYRIILQKEYEYLTSKPAIIETIEANEYEFLESGVLA